MRHRRSIRILRRSGALTLLAALAFAATAAAQTSVHDCTFCHVNHTAPGPTLTIAEDVEVLCLTCHGPLGTSPLKAEVHTNSQGSGYSFRMSCIVCHTPHSSRANWLGGTNLEQVGAKVDDSGFARIDTPNSGIREVVFESRGLEAGEPTLHSFADNDEDANGYRDGVCETCHTLTSHHRNDTSDAGHYIGATCTECHPHDAGFLPVAGACIDCHASPQDNGDGLPPGGRRAVVGEFALRSHHVQSLEPTDADCVACHEMSEHQQGYVRLRNADDPENPSLVVVLAGDPSVDPAEAALLEPICLACHDADGAAGSPPFSDGIAPPVIDAAAWTGASHNVGAAGQMTCFGDGETFGCHASGHGSRKATLLAPWTVAPTPPANAEEEEGFCFSCHDADGPAASDVAGRFAAAVRWVTAPAGPLNNSHLNDRHDVQYAVQTLSGAKIECTDCHDPHTATDLAPLVPDPDPGDGRVPGTGDVFPNGDFLTEWCLDCHDGSFPPDVIGPNVAITNVRSTYTNDDAHGAQGGNPSLKSGYGWAQDQIVPCYACHTLEHVSQKTNLFQCVDLVKSADGTIDIPSDSVGLDYEVTDNNVVNLQINGYEWCNTCHTNSMGRRRANCFECHYHGDRM